MKIGELAAKAECNVQTVRFYERDAYGQYQPISLDLAAVLA